MKDGEGRFVEKYPINLFESALIELKKSDANELAEKIGCNIRTVNRKMKELSESNNNIKIEKHAGRWKYEMCNLQ